jgi:hypothetical protein
MAAVVYTLHSAVFWNLTPVLLPSSVPMPPPVDLLIRAHSLLSAHNNVDGGIYTPSLLREMAKSPSAIPIFKNLKHVAFGGAPLDRWVGDLLCQYTTVMPVIGATEAAMYPTIQHPSRLDWKYYRFHPAIGYHFQPLPAPNPDNLHEFHIVRNPELEGMQVVFQTFPELTDFNTKDLYKPHPTLPETWEYAGRGDDLVKLSWLAKFHASDVESLVESHPLISSALMGGEGRDVPFLLVEPKSSTLGKPEKAALLAEVKQSIRHINKQDTEEVRIPDEMVMLSDPARPFQKTSKGTLSRKFILENYQKDIEGLYARRGSQKNEGLKNGVREDVAVAT